MFTRQPVTAKLTRKNPKLPKILKALRPEQIQRAFLPPTSRMASYIMVRKLTGGNPLNVDTGRLRASILPSVFAKGTSAFIGTDVHYGAIWELGGPKRTARPWLLPGAEEHMASGEYMDLFKKALLRELR